MISGRSLLLGLCGSTLLSLTITGCASSRDALSTTRNNLPRPRPRPPEVMPVAQKTFEVDLGGWTSRGVLSLPLTLDPSARFPLVILIHGNGPQDLDATIPQRVDPLTGERPAPTRLFAQIARGLSARGFAVARYDKRWVRGAGDFERSFFVQQSTKTFAKDVETVLEYVTANFPQVEGTPRYLYGWSEGTAIAATLATTRDDIDAIVLHGAVTMPWRDTVRFWLEEVAFPYADGVWSPGMITPEDLQDALDGPGGLVAKLGTRFLIDPSWDGESLPPVSTLIDVNGDGKLGRKAEIDPKIPDILDAAFGPYGITSVYSEGRTVPYVGAVIDKIPCDVLVLQGDNDASTPAIGLDDIIAARPERPDQPDYIYFPGLGHTLGSADSFADDVGRSMEDDIVLPIVAGWLRERPR